MKNMYLYAVANTRANEAALLTKNDLEQLIKAPDYGSAISLLADKGYSAPEDTSYSAMLDREAEKTWALLQENAPEAKVLRLFIIKNDFQNLKACLKGTVMGSDVRNYLVSPSVVDGETLLEAVQERKFSELPEFIAETARHACETLVQTANGQLCDIEVDCACLKEMLNIAQEEKNGLLTQYARLFVLAADLKTVCRCVRTGKGRGFMQTAVCEVEGLDKKALLEAAAGGEESFFEYLDSSGLESFAGVMRESASAFEKFCDDRMMELMKKAKFTAIGPSPLAAYFFARLTELGCVRIILSAKFNGSSEETVRERMRELYV